MGVKNLDLFTIPPAENLVPLPPPVAGLPYIPQTQTNWCWAACALMSFNRTAQLPIQQCKVVDKKFPNHDCCTNVLSDDCNRTCPAEEIADVYIKLGLQANPAKQVTTPSSMAKTIRDEIAASRPVEIYYNLRSGGGHVVLIAAVEPGNAEQEKFLVFDPAKPNALMTIEALRTLDNQGTWALYWNGIH